MDGRILGKAKDRKSRANSAGAICGCGEEVHHEFGTQSGRLHNQSPNLTIFIIGVTLNAAP